MHGTGKQLDLLRAVTQTCVLYIIISLSQMWPKISRSKYIRTKTIFSGYKEEEEGDDDDDDDKEDDDDDEESLYTRSSLADNSSLVLKSGTSLFHSKETVGSSLLPAVHMNNKQRNKIYMYQRFID